MPRPKLQQRAWGVHNVIVPSVEKHLRKLGHVIPADLPTLVLVAVKPAILLREDCAPERETFIRCLSQEPDITAEILSYVRKALRAKPESKAAVVREFLLAHNEMIKRRGKLQLIHPLAKGDKLITV